MANRLIVEIAGDTRPLERAFARVDRKAVAFERKTNRLGNRMRKGGMFAKAGLSALVFSGYVDDAARSVLKHFGVGGDAANAIVGFGSVVTDLALSFDGLGEKARKAAKKMRFPGGAGGGTPVPAGPAGKVGRAVRAGGKATGVGLAGVAAYEIARHTPGWDSLWRKVGGQVADDVSRVTKLVGGGRDQRPVEVTVNLDGQAVAKNTSKHQKRGSNRTANQTSGRRSGR